MSGQEGSLPGAAAARRLAARVAGLERAFDQVWRTRMQGLPLLNPVLWVEAVGFERFGDGDVALGVLVTPWFMNLILLPSTAPAPAAQTVPADWPLGALRAVEVGGERFDFIGATDPAVGAFGMCSLFSPMFEFGSQTGARATAQAVLTSLRGAAEATGRIGQVGGAEPANAARAALGATTGPARADVPAAAGAEPSAMACATLPRAAPGPARRAFLFGRPPAPAAP